jgi:hypothetical protein
METQESHYRDIPKEFTVTAKGWELLKAKLFGRKIEELRITAYVYKGKTYITRIL